MDGLAAGDLEHAPAPSDRIFRPHNLSDISRARCVSAGDGRMKATAPEKMMPVDKALKMRECEKRMEQQKIKMEDRSRFLDECVWAKAK